MPSKSSHFIVKDKNLAIEYLDMKELGKLTESEQIHQIRLCWPSWIKSAEQRILSIFDYEEGAITPAKNVENFANPYFYNTLARKAKQRKITTPNLAEIVNLAIRRKGVSCHYILFGFHKPVRLPAPVQKIVNLYDSAPVTEKMLAFSLLCKEQLTCNNVCYTLKTRIDELRSIHDLPAKLYCGVSRLQGVQRAAVLQFLNTPSPAVISEENGKPARILLHSTYYLSITNDIAADYFLMQDYSDHAVSADGNELSVEQKLFLSAYLSANTKARIEACNILLDNSSR